MFEGMSVDFLLGLMWGFAIAIICVLFALEVRQYLIDKEQTKVVE